MHVYRAPSPPSSNTNTANNSSGAKRTIIIQHITFFIPFSSPSSKSVSWRQRPEFHFFSSLLPLRQSTRQLPHHKSQIPNPKIQTHKRHPNQWSDAIASHGTDIKNKTAAGNGRDPNPFIFSFPFHVRFRDRIGSDGFEIWIQMHESHPYHGANACRILAPKRTAPGALLKSLQVKQKVNTIWVCAGPWSRSSSKSVLGAWLKHFKKLRGKTFKGLVKSADFRTSHFSKSAIHDSVCLAIYSFTTLCLLFFRCV